MTIKRAGKTTCVIVLEDDEKFSIKCHAYPKAKSQYHVFGLEGKRRTGYAEDDILLIGTEKFRVKEIYEVQNKFYLGLEEFPKKK